jgi:hypothetical protein
VSLPIEQWRPIPGYEGYYEASDQGRIRSVTRSVRYDNGRSRVYRGQVLKPQLGPHGRYTVRVSRQNKSRCFTVASLVLAAFRGPRPPGMECCHNDGNSTNDRADNLRWDTPSENSYDRVRHGTHASARKTHCPRDHALAPPNLIGPGKKTKRRCRACVMAGDRVLLSEDPAKHRELADDYYRRIMNGDIPCRRPRVAQTTAPDRSRSSTPPPSPPASPQRQESYSPSSWRRACWALTIRTASAKASRPS